MPEGPELCLASRFVTKIGAKHVFGGQIVKSEVSHKNPEVPFQAQKYKIWAESRGKEMKVFLEEVSQKKSNRLHVLFRFGMSGCFKFTKLAELPKHAHLRFFTVDRKHVLSFVDYRRFGRWEINGDWGKDRGPDAVREYQHVAFNKPICEVLMNQKFFNGIGNYLRAEILFRGGVPPFDPAREVLESLSMKQDPSIKIKFEKPDILELCHTIQKEVLSLGGGKGYDVENNAEDQAVFMNWLQCYYQDGMTNLVDSNKRTVWFSGHPGKLAPKNGISRGKVGSQKPPTPVKIKKTMKVKIETDHDYSPKKLRSRTKK
ncbi:hypothetical protein TCAL_06713 [Tigriopus californicus]|uniref:Formamidopyrimidine-DNA glycosylase catalytic domain-containing protein n=1 Tax=Tigriopus californicus TaxID=6832 RepID=A0A553P8Q9_TIGCA|nr:hypothetical protein TCAL_06713 [Tigriopus californicus]|eukprot:TCALIF_06713-PA protein Name:"Similar to NEIL1 Endonuclease 8-like 1 (Homo sapiens)" AED:0.04 eAED:0.04 QI:0/0.33/0.25/1/1/1/4/35/315